MIELETRHLGTIRLHNKSVLILRAGSPRTAFVNEEYEVIVVVAGIDRSLDLNLRIPTVLIVEAGIRTRVSATGPQAAQSKAIFIAGLENEVTGIPTQDTGRCVAGGGRDFDLGALSVLKKVIVE